MRLQPLVPHAYQTSAIEQILDHKQTLVYAGVGSGKTLVGVEAMLRAETAVNLIVAPLNTFRGWQKTLQRQGGKELQFIDARKVGKEAHRQLALGVPGYYFMGTERMRTQAWASWKLDFVIIDECFVAGTKIETPEGQRNIEDLRIGDVVYGYDHDNDRVVATTVRNLMQRESSTIMPNGATVNHPYWVEDVGYIPLGDVTREDYLYEFKEAGSSQDSPRVQKLRGDLLLSRMEDAPLREELCSENKVAGESTTGKSAEGGSQTILSVRSWAGKVFCALEAALAKTRIPRKGQGTDERKQSYKQPRNYQKGIGNQATERSYLQTPDGREWNWIDLSREDVVRSSRVGNTVLSKDWPEEGQRVSLPLQAGRSKSGIADWSRVRWAEPLSTYTEGTGREENASSRGTGLDYLEILEPRNRERFGRVLIQSAGASQTVYNIETGTGNYFAGGMLVHNCHKLSNRKSKTFKMAKTMKALYRVGLSATPAGNKPEGLYAVGKWHWPKTIPNSFVKWAQEYLYPEYNPFSQFNDWGAEREPGTIMKDFPSVARMPSSYTGKPAIHDIMVELNPTQRKVYKQLEGEAIAFLEDNSLMVVDLPSTLYIRLIETTLATPSVEKVVDEESGEVKDKIYFKPDAKSSKADALLEILSDLPPQPVLVFTHSRKFAEFLTQRLVSKNYSAKAFVGGLGAQERLDLLDGFGKTFDILVATIPAIGEGTDGIQDVCATECWMSVSDNNVLNTQAKGRLSRQGQEKLVNRYVLRAQGTVEEKQAGRLALDLSILEESLDTK